MGNLIDEYNAQHGDWDAMEYAHLIDVELNITKTSQTPAEAAAKRVPPEWQARAITEYQRWQERKNK